MHKKTRHTNSASTRWKSVTCLSRFLLYIGCGMLLLLTLLTTADVVGRYFFNKPVNGAFELIGLFLVCIFALGIGYGQQQKVHARVTILYRHTSDKTQSVIDIISYIIGIACGSIICWRLVILGKLYIQRGHGGLSEVLGIPIAPFMILLGLGIGFFVLILFIDIHNVLTRNIRK